MRIDLALANTDRPDEKVSVEGALVDTGATFTVLPRDLARLLDLKILRQRQTRTAAGMQTLDESFALFEYDGDQTVTPVVISDTLEFVLVGVITLEALALAVDPVNGELRETDVFLL